ncbi:MAG: hypothetical protein IKQ69_08605 [Oscillospiraceae bacterium]|nr:hypothetical protein [Oscillospiraceae bacterium]
MDEIQKILSDPSAMEKLSHMAQELMGGAAPEAPSPAAALPEWMKGLRGGHPLADLLGPYLGEERRQRLARALNTARAVRLSGSLLGRDGHGL